MEVNSNTSNTMPTSLPPRPPPVQSSIRTFFQPQTPTYAPPPASSIVSSGSPPAPNVSQIPRTPSLPPALDSRGATLAKSLPERASITTIQEPHIQPLRRINSLLLPISYPDSFYHSILTPGNFSRVIQWTDANVGAESKVVGGIVCRLDANPVDATSHDIYIQSLVLLSPYRSQGLATNALDTVISAAVAQKEVKVASLYAHVWTENSEGLEWYTARGFQRDEGVIPAYYRRLKPDTALLLRRRLSPSDHLSYSPPASTTSAPPKPKGPARPMMPKHAASFQDRRPEREWNDLPTDLGLLRVPSVPSSRSSSTTRSTGGKKKKERSYPSAAFGA
ncbi:N-acetyltransferase san [Phlyctema vagabunda]|uniref:N-acetyltransferase san n=1 Tax=Phlyctema vagabunda TaxID=108571 RepID=A0ABR4PT86_9HELO